jgi:SpoVK/Ycf46/Vps4 family AAA+-type ATPase
MPPYDKYGSPYDPRNRALPGKVMREREPEARHREQGPLGPGCGNSNCPLCYPERAGRNNGMASTGWSRTSIGASDIEYMRQMSEIMWNGNGINSASTQAAPRIPASLTEARKAVEKYIITAPEQTFADIFGNEDALAQLKDAIEAPVKHAELYKAYGMSMPKGALLSGPPGCGKTMFARAAASEMRNLYGKDTELVSISGSELQSMFVGETEERIKAIFTYAREYKAHHGHPLLVFMDEAEVLLPDRTGRFRRVASWEESQVATFLAEMDGMQASGAFVLLATNRPEAIDSAVLRDGRCDFKITVKPPSRDAIEAIVRKGLDKCLLADPIDQLVVTAVESLYDPHKVIMDARSIGIDLEHERFVPLHHKHFLMEHIVSGAIAASIPARATRYAFARDKADGQARGIVVADVIASTTDLFNENRGLEHPFAMTEFKREFEVEAERIAAAYSEKHSPSRDKLQ